jgi:hypothetical protein
MSLSNAFKWSARFLLGILRLVLKYQTPVLPVTSGPCGPARYFSPFRYALVGFALMTREISSGSSASPAKRSVANALIVLSDFVVDVAEDIAVLIRDRPIIIYDNTFRRTKIARGFEFMNRISELLACDAELVANVLGTDFPAGPK